MSNNKQSSVEYYAFEALRLRVLLENRTISVGEYAVKHHELLEQAKAMHKEEQEQLSTAWAKSREQTRESAMHIGFAKGFMSGLECHEDYYEELNRTNLDEDEFTRNYIVDEFEKAYVGGNHE